MFDWCQGLGMCVHTVLPNNNCKMCSQSILLKRFLSRGKSTQFGWLKSIPSHLVLPHLDTSFIEGCAVAHSVASQDEGPCFCQYLMILFHGQRTVSKHVKGNVPYNKQCVDCLKSCKTFGKQLHICLYSFTHMAHCLPARKVFSTVPFSMP